MTTLVRPEIGLLEPNGLSGSHIICTTPTPSPNIHAAYKVKLKMQMKQAEENDFLVHPGDISDEHHIQSFAIFKRKCVFSLTPVVPVVFCRQARLRATDNTMADMTLPGCASCLHLDIDDNMVLDFNINGAAYQSRNTVLVLPSADLK